MNQKWNNQMIPIIITLLILSTVKSKRSDTRTKKTNKILGKTRKEEKNLIITSNTMKNPQIQRITIRKRYKTLLRMKPDKVNLDFIEVRLM